MCVMGTGGGPGSAKKRMLMPEIAVEMGQGGARGNKDDDGNPAWTRRPPFLSDPTRPRKTTLRKAALSSRFSQSAGLCHTSRTSTAGGLPEEASGPGTPEGSTNRRGGSA